MKQFNRKFIRKEPLYVKDGVPVFTQNRYWGKVSAQEMEKALSLIENKGWHVFDKDFYKKFDFTYEENRADWRFMVPLDKNSVVLDAGAGMGRTAIPLARVVGEVVAFDQSFLRMKFLKMRAEKEGLDNITVLVGDIFDLPFEENTFDLITMNGVLEWVGKTDKFDNPKEAQIEALKTCKRLLKPDGYLYIGIENRFALAYLRGTDHSGLRFTSYMPRFVANLYTKMRKKGSYNTYTYSKRGYCRLLEKAGFKKPVFYLPYPGYNLPRIVIPYENLNALRYVICSLMSPDSFLKKATKFLFNFKPVVFLYRLFFFSFNIIVKND